MEIFIFFLIVVSYLATLDFGHKKYKTVKLKPIYIDRHKIKGRLLTRG